MPPLGRERVVQAGRRLERDARVATGLEEAAERRRRRNLRAAAAHLRAQPALGERGHLLLEPVVERQLDIGLAGEPVEPRLPARLDRLGAQIAAVGRVDEHRQRSVLALELVQPRGGPDEPRQQPAVLVGAGAAVLVERVGHGEARGREERRVVDQGGERRAARVAHRAAARAPRHRGACSNRARAAETTSLNPGRSIANRRPSGGSPVRPASTTSAARYVPSGLG